MTHNPAFALGDSFLSHAGFKLVPVCFFQLVHSEEYGCEREEKNLDRLEYRYRFVSRRVGDNLCEGQRTLGVAHDHTNGARIRVDDCFRAVLSLGLCCFGARERL